MIENKQFERLENSRVKLTITISAEKTQRAYDYLVKKYIKQAQLSGFRKGKAPQAMIIRKFGHDITRSAMAEIVEKATEEVLKSISEDDYLPISKLEADELNPIEPGNPYIFSVSYDVSPQVVHGEYRGIELKKPKVQITEKHINEKLEEFRKQNAVVIEKEDGMISSGTVVTMDYTELDVDGKPLEDTRYKGFTFTLGETSHPYGIEADIEGMEAGEELIVVKTYGDEARPALAGRTVHLHIVITAVKEWQLPELNDELAQDVSEDFKTLDDLIERIKSELEASAEAMLRNNMFESIVEKLLEGADFQLPQSMIEAELKRYLDNISLSYKDSEMEKSRNDLRPIAERIVKLRLIYAKIVNDEGIAVSDEEMQDIIKEQAAIYDETPEEYQRRSNSEKKIRYIKDQQVYCKLRDFLLDSAVVSPGETVDYNDLTH